MPNTYQLHFKAAENDPMLHIDRCVQFERTVQQYGRTQGLNVAADELWTLLLGLSHTHVPRDAGSPGGIVDCYQAFPLLHSYRFFPGYGKSSLLDLTCTSQSERLDVAVS